MPGCGGYTAISATGKNSSLHEGNAVTSGKNEHSRWSPILQSIKDSNRTMGKEGLSFNLYGERLTSLRVKKLFRQSLLACEPVLHPQMSVARNGRSVTLT